MNISIGAYNVLSEMNSLLHGNNECNSYKVHILMCIKCSLVWIF